MAESKNRSFSPPLSWKEILIGVLFIWIFFGIAPHWLVGNNSEERGQYGDQFGAVNALFSGLAAGGLLWTIWQQRKEIDLVQEQLDVLESDQKKSQRVNSLCAILDSRTAMFQMHLDVQRGPDFPTLSKEDQERLDSTTAILTHTMRTLAAESGLDFEKITNPDGDLRAEASQ